MAYVNQTEIDNFVAKAQRRIAELGGIIAAATEKNLPFEDEVFLSFELSSLIKSLDDFYIDWDEHDILRYIHYYNSKANIISPAFVSTPKLKISVIWPTSGGGGGGISEAPLDGNIYGRQSSSWKRIDNLYAPISHSQAWTTITSTPTTIAGYGITDTYTKTEANAKYVTSVTGGDGVDVTTGLTPTASFNANSIAEKSGALVGSDRIVGESGGTNFAETISLIPLSIFSNNENWNNYVHPNHTGDVTSSADGAQTLANSVVTNAKMANMTAYALKANATAASAVPTDVLISSLTDELTPTTGDWILGETAAGVLVKYNIGNLPSGGGGEINTHSSIGGGLAITAATSKVGVDLKLVSVAAAGNGIAASLASDLLTIDMDINSLTTETSIAAGDFVPFWDITVPTNKKITFANFEGLITGSNIVNDLGWGSSYVHPNHTGDVTSVADGAQTIANNAVTLAKMADMVTASFIGRNTAGTGDPEILSTATAKTMLDLSGTNTGDQTMETLLDTDITPIIDLQQGSLLSWNDTTSKWVQTDSIGVAQGGTGRGTLTSGYILLGNGTSAITMTAPNTAFNKNFGTSSAQVAYGNHTHSLVYEPLNSHLTEDNIAETISAIWTFTAIPKFNGGISGTSAPFLVDSSQMVNGLNANYLGGYTSSQFPRKAEAATITNNWTFGSYTVTAGNFIDSSDRNIKKDISKICGCNIKAIDLVTPVSYRLKKGDGKLQYGVIAQELQEIFPELIHEGNDGILGVDYRSLAILTMAKVQELQKQLNKLIDG